MKDVFEGDIEGLSKAINWLKYIGVDKDPEGKLDIAHDVNALALANRLAISELMGTSVRCDNKADYHIVATLYYRAGCQPWPWHKGYKRPDLEEPENDCPYYGWEHAGFMKHIWPPAPESIITLRQLIDIVSKRLKD